MHYAGYNLGNVIGWVDAIQPGAMWETTRDVKEKILGGKANKLTSAEEAGALFVFYVFFLRLCKFLFHIVCLRVLPRQW